MITETFQRLTVRMTSPSLGKLAEFSDDSLLILANVDVFLEAITIASACNKVLRERFLKPNTIGLIPIGGYRCNINHST